MNWNVENKKEGFPIDLEKKYGKIILQLLANRKLETVRDIESFFQFDWEKDTVGQLEMAEMKKAVERIAKAKKSG